MKNAKRTGLTFLLASVLYSGLFSHFVSAQVEGPIGGSQENSGNGPASTPRPTQIRVGASVPKAVIQAPPSYPQAAIDQKIEGNVVLHLLINGDGTVREATPISGSDVLTNSAIEAVKQWKYRPEVLDGNALEVDTTVTLNYVLGPPPIVMVNNHPFPGGEAPNYSREPFVIENLSTKVTFENDGTDFVELTAKVHIQAQAGVQQFGLLSFPYASANSSAEVVYVRVTKADGRVVETPAENVLDMPADITKQAPFYSDIHEKQVAVKGLEIGDTLEYQFSETEKTPIAPGQFWYSYTFPKVGIVLQEELQIKVPNQKYVKVQSQEVQPSISDGSTYRIYKWDTSNLKSAPQGTDAGAGTQAQFPSVQVTTFRSWDEVGQWFRGLAAPRAMPTPEIQAKADEVTRGMKTDTEKIQAIYNFVSTKYRYIGISLGIGRYQPHSAADVLGNDYGDCKDKHTLFAALLAAAGVKAYPALINSDSGIDPDVPYPGQFDHVITAIPRDKGFLFLDTTPEVAPFGLLLANLRDKKALVMPDNSPAELVQTPADPPFKSFFTFQADGTLDDAGTLETQMQMTFRGDDEVIYRAVLRQSGQAQYDAVLQKISSNLNFGGTVSDATATPTDATDSPFHIEYSYNRKEYSDWADKQISPPFPPIFFDPVPDDADKNPQPIKLGSPMEDHYQANIKLPADLRASLRPAVDLVESFAEYHDSYSVSDGTLHFDRRLIVKAPQVAPAQIEAYRKFLKAMTDNEDSFISLSSASSPTAANAEDPEVWALLKQSEDAIKRGDLPTALDDAQHAVNKNRQSADGWYLLGYVNIHLGKFDEGTEEMKEAIDLDPNREAAYGGISSTLTSMGRREAALDLLKEIEKKNPQDKDAPRRAGALLLDMKRYPEAVTELDNAIAMSPEDSSLRLSLGDALNAFAYDLADSNANLPQALEYAEKAEAIIERRTSDISLDTLSLDDVKTVPKLANFWETLGWVHFRMGHLDLAEKYLEAAWSLSQEPIFADHLGQLYEKEGKTNEAATTHLYTSRNKSDLWRVSQKFRSVTLEEFPGKPAKHVSADFFLLFAPGPKIIDVRFVSGDEELHGKEKAVSTAKFDVRFPDDTPGQILRRGTLDCEPVVPGCTLVLFLPEDVDTIK